MAFDTRYTFADDESAREFSEKRLAFLNRHKNRDRSYRFTEHFEIPGMEENMLACEDEAAKPSWLNQTTWSWATALCCGVCFRKLYTSATLESEYTYIKRLYSHPCPPGPVASHVTVVCPMPNRNLRRVLTQASTHAGPASAAWECC